MNNEDQVIFDEITEELKHDQFVKFVKRYQTPIFGVVLAAVAGIVMYTSWKNRSLKELEDTTYALADTLLARNEKSEIVLSSMSQNAPSKIKPIVNILKEGLSLKTEKDSKKRLVCLENLLALSHKVSIDIVWRDLAILVYASNVILDSNVKLNDVVLKLQPLSEEGRPFRLSAIELLGLIYMNSGDKIKAESYFDQIIAEKNCSDNMKKRALLYKNRMTK